jgi:hypothetical protein
MNIDMAARTRRIFCDDNTRAKIQTTQIIKRLTDHILGNVELNPSQVSAALGLLKKTIPDLSATQHSGTVNLNNNVNDLPDSELADIAATGSNRTAKAKTGSQKVH